MRRRVLTVLVCLAMLVSSLASAWTVTVDDFGVLSGSTKTWKVAWVLLDAPGVPVTDRSIEIMNRAKELFAQDFVIATDGLATVDVSPLIVLHMSGTYFNAPVFYSNGNPDNYDFLVVGVMWSYPASYNRLRSNVKGIGPDQLGTTVHDADPQTAAVTKKLLGFFLFGPVEVGSDTVEQGAHNHAVDAVHDISHQWLAWISFMDGATKSDELRRWCYGAGSYKCHWSPFLNIGNDVMLGYSWTDNHDGTFTYTPASFDINDPYTFPRFSKLDLYLMGLLPSSAVPPTFLVVPTDGTDWQTLGGKPNHTVIGTSKTVTIEQIIAAEGIREEVCTGDYAILCSASSSTSPATTTAPGCLTGWTLDANGNCVTVITSVMVVTRSGVSVVTSSITRTQTSSSSRYDATVRVGEVAKISLPVNPSTGCSWWVHSAPSTIEINATEGVLSVDCAGMVGCSNQIVTYSFKPTVPGDYTIELRSGHAWAKQEYYEVVIIRLTVPDANVTITTPGLDRALTDLWNWLWHLGCWIPGSNC